MQDHSVQTAAKGSSPTGRGARSTQTGANMRLVLGLLLAGLVVLFTLQNADVVQLRFLFWTWAMPRAVMIFGVLVTGVLLGWLLANWLHRKKNG